MHMDFLTVNPEMTSVLFSEEIFEPREWIQQKLQEIIRDRHQFLNQLLQEALRKGEIVNAPIGDLSTVILGYIRMIVLEWRMANFSFSLQKRGEQLIQTLDKIIFINQ